MKPKSASRRSGQFIVSTLSGAFLLLVATITQADVVRTQTIQLRQGWNSIFLEVSPTNSDPATALGQLPVGIVAAYYALETPVEFIKDPASIGWKKEGWAVWYAPSRPDGFLSTLHALHGNKAYLIHAEQDCTWNIAGTVLLEPIRWKGNSFNLLGFGLDPQAPPTFAKFFAASKAHQQLRAYQLVSDRWQLIQNPVGTLMKAGEAYWIFSQGSSDHQGPLTVSLDMGRSVLLRDNGGAANISLKNASTDPVAISVEQLSGPQSLPLAYLVRGFSSNQVSQLSVDLPARLQLPVQEALSGTALKLELRGERMTEAQQSCLLKISTDAGTQIWIPVIGSRTDLEATP